MQKIMLLLLLGLLGTSSACFIDIDDEGVTIGCVDGDGPLVSETLEVAPFDELIVRLPVTVRIQQGAVQSVEVDGKPNIIDELELDVDNGVWEIESARCLRDLGPMTFFITVTDLRSLRVTGSGSIISDDVLEVNDLELRVSGSGDMNLALEADDIDCKISGSGDIFLEGEADDMELKISGAGDLMAFNFFLSRCDLDVSGSGDAEVRVSDRLEGRISGSGDVAFKGDPVIDVQISGAGDLVNAN